jgi:hypothetical protein
MGNSQYWLTIHPEPQMPEHLPLNPVFLQDALPIKDGIQKLALSP